MNLLEPVLLGHSVLEGLNTGARLSCFVCFLFVSARYVNRGEQSVTVTRVPLGTDYDLLLWFAPQSDDAGISVRPRTVQASIIGDVIKVHPIRGVTW